MYADGMIGIIGCGCVQVWYPNFMILCCLIIFVLIGLYYIQMAENPHIDIF